MVSRRMLLRLAASFTIAGATWRSSMSSAQEPTHHVYLPSVTGGTAPEATPEPPPAEEGLLLNRATGTSERAINWFAARSNLYTEYDITTIVGAYQRIGDEVGIDWFLALAQCAHETGSLTSWWCDRPRRNPAGLGVTGRNVAGSPDQPPGPHWAWRDGRWWEGISFAAWDSFAVRAHLGRLLAYALPAGAGTPPQQDAINYALGLRPLPSRLRGVARTIIDLNGRWAVPGNTYGQSILNLAARMRSG